MFEHLGVRLIGADGSRIIFRLADETPETTTLQVRASAGGVRTPAVAIPTAADPTSLDPRFCPRSLSRSTPPARRSRRARSRLPRTLRPRPAHSRLTRPRRWPGWSPSLSRSARWMSYSPPPARQSSRDGSGRFVAAVSLCSLAGQRAVWGGRASSATTRCRPKQFWSLLLIDQK